MSLDQIKPEDLRPGNVLTMRLSRIKGREQVVERMIDQMERALVGTGLEAVMTVHRTSEDTATIDMSLHTAKAATAH